MKLTKHQKVSILETAQHNYRVSMPDQREGQQVHLAECWLDALISVLKSQGIIITSRDATTGIETTLEV
jgi:hypothetical protein